MRVVIKPAGVLIILFLVSVLGTLAYLRTKTPVTRAEAEDATQQKSTVTVAARNLLTNGDFEGESEPVNGTWPNSKGTATGIQAKGWLENSLWGNIKLVYALDKKNPHGGATSQSIKIVANDGGQVQFVQERPSLVGKNYEASLWVRASEKNLPVTFTLRQAGEPYTPYKSVEANVGTEWQKLSVVGSPTKEGNMYTMITFRNIGATLWVDDATLYERP